MLSLFEYHREYSKKYLLVIGTIILIGIMLAVWVSVSYPDKVVRQKYVNSIFKVDGRKVNKIMIEPYNPSGFCSKYTNTVFIKNKMEIEEFCNQLTKSSSYFPSHPTNKWSCVVSLFTRNDTIKFLAVETANNQGFMIPVNSKVTSGWNYGHYRNDKLGRIIQKIWDQSKDKNY